MSIIRSSYGKLLKVRRDLTNSLFGDREYRKFVMVSDSRTGSTLLMSLLNSHPEIVAEGEIFKLLGNRSCENIWSGFFKNFPKRIKYAGFKLFYDHPRGDDQKVWELIENDKSIIIIHLKRNNLLRSLVSKRIGLNTKKWTQNINQQDDIKIEEKKISLEKDECENYFNRIRDFESKTDERFKNHTLISISYEELSRNKQKVISQVFKKMDLKDHLVLSTMKKQNPEPLSVLIKNYESLKLAFKNTEWRSFFQ